MARKKLKYNFHNPNTEDETVKYISTLLAESINHKMVKVSDEKDVKKYPATAIA